MARERDLDKICVLVLKALKRLESRGESVVVARGGRYGLDLRSQLEIKGVHQSDVCRAVNLLVAEDAVFRDDTASVEAYGSLSDPIKEKASAFYLTGKGRERLSEVRARELAGVALGEFVKAS